VIPDVQSKPGVDPSFLKAVGQYIADHRPDKIICLGDFADMESLSSYDKGKKSFEGRRYVRDVDAAKRAMEVLMEPILKAAGYDPLMVMLYGNHEDRISRACDLQAEFDGVISLDDLGYEDAGWNTIPFLKPIIIDGVAYAHYFVSGVMGRPITTANALLTKKHMSCVAGHQQGRQIATATTGDGRIITGIIAGSCYEHEESYLGPQSNQHWRGMIFLNDVKNGTFDEMPLSLRYLRDRYG